MNVNNVDTSILFGGTWSKIEAKFLIGSGSAIGEGGEPYNFQPGAIGGEYSHKLTINEMPKHNHTQSLKDSGSRSGWAGYDWLVTNTSRDYAGRDLAQYTGGDGYNNNLPKFFVVNIWKRTA